MYAEGQVLAVVEMKCIKSCTEVQFLDTSTWVFPFDAVTSFSYNSSLTH